MKFTTQKLGMTLQNQLKKFIGGLLVLTLVWQMLGVDTALATSVDSMSKQVSGKTEQIKGAATQSMGKAQSAMEDTTGAAKMKVKDGLNETKIATDASSNRVENAAEKVTDKIKNFFGK